jgi:ribosomal protein L35AE/L33A
LGRDPTITASPNPSNGLIKLTWSTGSEQAADVDVYNILGQLVCKVKEGSFNEMRSEIISLHGKSGVYLATVRVRGTNKYNTFKFTILR